MHNEPLAHASQEDFVGLLSCRAHQLVERMVDESEVDEGKSALSRLLALTTAAGDGAEAEAIQMATPPAVVAGNITSRSNRPCHFPLSRDDPA